MNLNNHELEISVLSHIIKNPKSLDKLLARRITKEHFDHIGEGDKVSYTSSLFKLILDYWTESGGAVMTTFVLESKMDQFKVNDKNRAKLFSLWAEVQDNEINDNDLHELLSQLKNKRCNKLLTDTLYELNEKIKDKGLDNALEVLKNGLDLIQVEKNEISADKQSFDITESADFYKSEYEKRINNPEQYKGIECGLSNIDSQTFGWMPGQIVVFLAPSSGGKSVMLLNAAMHANVNNKKKVLYLSFEMSAWLCLLRHISLQFEIPFDELKSNNISKDELNTIMDGLNKTKGGPYFEYDVNMEDPTPEYIDSKIRDLIATKGKPDLLVVDYIGNMTVRNAPNNAKDWELQSAAVKELFRMAKYYNIPILTAQQFNRETIRDSRKSKEANKFMTYDQAAASGGQNLMHLCHYAIAMEPNKEKGYCVLHPVKMRDAMFRAFPVAMDQAYNKVRELSPEEQEVIMSMHSMVTGNATVTPTSGTDSTGKTPLNKTKVETDEDEEFVMPKFDDEEEIDLAGWVLS